MKAITVSVWIDAWEINEHSMYMDKWELKIGKFTIKNVSRKCLWYHSFGHALNYSCNVWMIRIVQKVWKVLLHQYFQDFWFGEVTWINLSWEVFTSIKPWEVWSKAQLLTSSFWLWVSVTPLQMANAYSIIANWWIYIRPRIIDEIKYPDWKVVKYKSEEVRRVIKKSTSDTVIKMLVDSATNWVANKWSVEWFSVAWKTWTAQINEKWIYELWQWTTIWSYAWFWPAEDPKFVIIVKLDRPRGGLWYWWLTSAYIFKDIASYLFDYYWIPKKNIIKK
jgi:cell division protein FtsI/penicillin-binding protein 2